MHRFYCAAIGKRYAASPKLTTTTAPDFQRVRCTAVIRSQKLVAQHLVVTELPHQRANLFVTFDEVIFFFLPGRFGRT